MQLSERNFLVRVGEHLLSALYLGAVNLSSFFLRMVRYWMHRSSLIKKLVEPHVQKLFPFHKPEMEGVSPVQATYSGKVVKAPFDLALGKIVPFGQSLTGSREEIVKVKVHKLCLNKFLLKVCLPLLSKPFSIIIKLAPTGHISKIWTSTLVILC